GYPYSEGIAEDINKVLMSELFFNKSVEFDNVLTEYINFEYSPDVTDDVKQLISLLEYNQSLCETEKRCDLEKAEEAEALAEKINKCPTLQKDYWRWRILYIRAKLEKERLTLVCQGIHPHKAEWSENAKEYMRELNRIYCFEGKYTGVLSDNHSWVSPPIYL
ncbi:MAG: hypothetical protein KBT47_02130, partial [Armatimonadetes bacterium]|nr:hypothetical protein [Candidatus Hippobium faecium]